MTSVNMPRDDAAIHSTKTATNRTVKETQPYPEAHAVQAHEDAAQAPRKHPQKAQQRRTHERRQEDEQVLLDTRSGHDRRNAADPQNADDEDDDKKSSGINIYT
jgi:hypothetical protein